MCRLRRDGASDRPRWENGGWAGTAPHRRRRSGCTAGRHTAVKAGVPVRRPGFRERTVCAGVCTSSKGEGVSAAVPPRSCALDRALCVFFRPEYAGGPGRCGASAPQRPFLFRFVRIAPRFALVWNAEASAVNSVCGVSAPCLPAAFFLSVSPSAGKTIARNSRCPFPGPLAMSTKCLPKKAQNPWGTRVLRFSIFWVSTRCLPS